MTNHQWCLTPWIMIIIVTGLLQQNSCVAVSRGQAHAQQLILKDSLAARSLKSSDMASSGRKNTYVPDETDDSNSATAAPSYPDVIGVIPLDSFLNYPPDPTVFSPSLHTGNLRSDDNYLSLANGLQAKVIARSGEFVEFPSTAELSDEVFLGGPAGGGTFSIGDSSGGGWIYVTNARSEGGGVGMLEFDSRGGLVGYRRWNAGSMNRGGGKTPWNSWITCEAYGCWQTDPLGNRSPQATALALLKDLHSVVYYINGDGKVEFFVSQSSSDGSIIRFTPSTGGQTCFESEDPWCTLFRGDYAYLSINDDGTFDWSDEPSSDPTDDQIHSSEFMKVVGNVLYVVDKEKSRVYELFLDSQSYTYTDSAVELTPLVGESIFFFPDGPMVQGRDSEVGFFTLIYTDAFGVNETVSVVISPDGKHLYAAYESSGLIYDVTRIDGGDFEGPVVDIDYPTLI